MSQIDLNFAQFSNLPDLDRRESKKVVYYVWVRKLL